MVIIIGDSWGVGEWDRRCNLSGPGLGNYLMLHDRVINLSVGAGSNTDSLDRLANLLERFKPDHYDTFFWIVTCPSRCGKPEDYVNGLMSAHINLLHRSLSQANTIAQEYNIKIQLIGGLCDLDSVNISAYKNLSMRVQSWGQLLKADYSTWPGLPLQEFWEQVGNLVEKQHTQLVEEWIEISNKMLLKTQCWDSMRASYFSTDGNHPDRKAHLLLHNHLYPEYAGKM